MPQVRIDHQSIKSEAALGAFIRECERLHLQHWPVENCMPGEFYPAQFHFSIWIALAELRQDPLLGPSQAVRSKP
jgi:hypothetical protein